MAADFTLRNAFSVPVPDGTDINLYYAYQVPGEGEGKPTSTLLDTQVQTNQQVTFAALATNRVYWAVAFVDGEYEWTEFLVPTPPSTGAQGPPGPSSPTAYENYTLRTGVSNADTLLPLDRTVSSIIPDGLGWWVIDPFSATSICEIRKGTVSDNNVTVSPALTHAHDADAAVFFITEGRIYTEWFGAKWDGTTDDHAAFMAAINAVGGSHGGWDESDQDPQPAGFTIVLPDADATGLPATARLSQQLTLNRMVRIEAAGAGSMDNGPILLFDPGVHGIVIGSDYTYPRQQHNGFGQGSKIGAFNIKGQNSARRRVITDAVVTATSATLTSATASFTSDDVGLALCEVQHVDNTNNFNIYPGSYIQSVTNGTTVVMSEPAIVNGTGVNIAIGGGCGLLSSARFEAHNTNVIGNFGGHGVHIKAAVSFSNANGWKLDNMYVSGAEVDGYNIQGNDANAGTAIACDAETNGRDGFHDESFLGNAYVGCESASNGRKNYHMGNAVPGGVTVSSLLACYSEGGSDPIYLDQYCLALNCVGISALQLSSDSRGQALGPGQAIINGADPGVWAETIGGGNWRSSKTPYFSIGGHSANVAAEMGSGVDGHQVEIIYNDYGAGDFSFVGDFSGGLVMMELTTPTDTNARGGGYVRYPRGWMDAKNHVETADTAAPTTGTWAQGDRVWNSAPTAGGKVGWVCTAAGTPGTWKPFGAIDA